MPVYQNSTVDIEKLIVGNCKIESAASATATYTNLGAGIVNSFTHNVERYEVQAGNAPDPLEGVSGEEATIEFELIEYEGSVLSAIMGGLISDTSTSVLSTITAGGNTNITPRAFKLTNTSYAADDGATIQTIMTVYKATVDAGPTFNFKSDNDADPIAVMPMTITAKLDTTRTKGDRLYTITRTIT